MCQFLSAIVTPEHRLLTLPYSDSHTDILEHHQIPDLSDIPNFVKIEFVPTDDIFNPETYELIIDQPEIPKWFDKDLTHKRVKKLLSNMIIREDRQALHAGKWLIPEGVTVKRVTCYIHELQGQIDYVYGSAKIHYVSGSAQINSVSGSAQINSVSDSARINNVYDSARIHNVYGSAQIHHVCNSAQINNVSGSAQINNVYGSARINNVYDSARIHNVYDSAKILNDERTKQ